VAMIAALLIQIATNFANDLSDCHKGADTAERVGPLRVAQSGLLTPGDLKRGIIITFGLAMLAGLYLISIGGWPILLIGIFSILSGLAYTGGPWPLGYHGLGDLFVFIFFGVIAVTGSAYLQSGHVSALALATSVPVGLLVTNILVINNLRDVETDRIAGKHTLAVLLGANQVRLQYAGFSLVAYLVPPLLWQLDGASPFVLLSWLTLPLSVRLVRIVMAGTSGRPLNRVLKATGQLHLLYGILLALGLLL
jgi:1,4-dihydroxy-2-naphthoate polyprenyltransferase